MTDRAAMPIFCLSAAHYSAPLTLRERLAHAAPTLYDALARAGSQHGAGPLQVTELALLSTCNRLELYAVAGDSAPAGEAWDRLVGLVSETAGVPTADLEPGAVRYLDRDAAVHLCRVAAGLDSMVLGESEILGQVADAHEEGLTRRSFGPVLSALFRAAIRAGKRARAETAIGRNAGSVSSVAVKLASTASGGLAGRTVAVVGAGRMARKAVTTLLGQGASEILVVNRSLAAAEDLAREWGISARALGDLASALACADVVIGSTSAPAPVISAALVREVMAGRRAPLVLLDIAVPRDVDPAVREIAGVHLFDLDDIQRQLERTTAERRAEIPRVEAIVAEEVRRFEGWLEARGRVAREQVARGAE